MNDTLTNFGYPQTLIAEWEHWVVLLRPAQVTLGACVLACKEEAKAYSAISEAAAAEQGRIVRDLEQALGFAFNYDKINYLMLMMVDPHVHYHVIPRYEQAQTFGGTTFEDAGWPALPQLGAVNETTEQERVAIGTYLLEHWPRELD